MESVIGALGDPLLSALSSLEEEIALQRRQLEAFKVTNSKMFGAVLENKQAEEVEQMVLLDEQIHAITRSKLT